VADLLRDLTSGTLGRPGHMLPGIYIAALGESGLMGEVLDRLRARS
jgi:hypothetical protein